MWIVLLLMVIAYLMGSVSSAILVCRMLGHGDPREGGSGNPGATNVLRLFGKQAAFLTLSGDLLKGLLPVLLGHSLGLSPGSLALVGAAAFCGHLYPLFFGFRGGKGVATYLGVLFGLHWLCGLGYALIWLLVAKVFRISSLAALIAALASPLLVALVMQDPAALLISVVLVVMLFWRHRSNIRALRDGREGHIQATEGEDPDQA